MGRKLTLRAFDEVIVKKDPQWILFRGYYLERVVDNRGRTIDFYLSPPHQHDITRLTTQLKGHPQMYCLLERFQHALTDSSR